jgi:hypothetical protein
VQRFRYTVNSATGEMNTDDPGTGEPTVHVVAAPASRAGNPCREVLLALAVALHRHGIYPQGHPLRQGASAAVVSALASLQGQSGALQAGSLGIGVMRDGFMVDDVDLPADAPLLKELVKRLHRHRIGAVSLSLDVAAPDLDVVLTAVAAEPDGTGVLPSVRGVDLRRLGYDQLTLAEGVEPAGTTPRALWEALARAALAAPEAGPAAASHDASGSALPPERLAADLGRLVDELERHGGGAEAEEVSSNVSELLRTLDYGMLGKVASLQPRRQEFLSAAAVVAAPDAFVRLMEAAGSESLAAKPSRGLLRVIAKLGTVAQSGTVEVAAAAREEVRTAIGRLVDEWTLEAPAPESYASLLDAVSFGPVRGAGVAAEEVGVERLVEISEDLDAWGDAPRRAVECLLEAGDVPRLLGLLRGGRDGSTVSREVTALVLTPRLLELMLAQEPIDRESLEDVTARMGESAIEPLLNVLAESPVRSVRRTIFDCLQRLGPGVAPYALARASDPRWYVTRNMLDVAACAPLPVEFDPMPYVTAADPRVRARAVSMLGGHPAAARVLQDVLAAETDGRVVAAALHVLGSDVPAHVVPGLLRIVGDESFSEQHMLAVRMLGRCHDPAVVAALVGLAGARQRWFGGVRLGRVSPVMLEALAALAAYHATSPDAAEVLAAARRSRDPRVRAAAEAR